jgi:hypothetical protein
MPLVSGSSSPTCRDCDISITIYHLMLDSMIKKEICYCKGYGVVLCLGWCFEVYHIYSLEGTIIPSRSCFVSVWNV